VSSKKKNSFDHGDYKNNHDTNLTGSRQPEGPFAILDGVIRSASHCLEKEPNAVTFYPGNRLSQLLRKQAAWLIEKDKKGHEFVDCTSVSVLHDAAYLCRSLLEVLLDHEASLISLPLDSSLSLFSSARFWGADSFLKHAKYLTAWPIASYLTDKNNPNDLPKPPQTWFFTNTVSKFGTGEEDPSFRDCFKGRICKYLKNRLVIKNNKNLHLWWSWLQGIKRGCAAASESTVIASLQDHSKALSKKGELNTRDDDDPFLVDLREKCRTFWNRAINNHVPPALRSRCDTPTVKCKKKDGSPDMTPSSGASWESPFKDGGTHNWLYDYFHYGLDRKVDYDENRNDLSSRIVRALDGQENLSKQRYYPSEFEQVNSDLLSMWYDSRSNIIREERGFPLNASFDELVQISRSGRFDHTNVEIIPLKEPLKIRTISKGNALKYWLAKPMQRMMRDLTRKYPQMALTGGPLESQHLEWLWTMTDQVRDRVAPFRPDLDLDFTHVVSGDYKGATDGLDIHATKMAFETVLSMVELPCQGSMALNSDSDFVQIDRTEVSEMWKNSLRDVLYEQLLHYPKGGPDATPQTNGQLMGSNLSFPILCVVNLIGYWMTLEEYTGLKFEPNHLPVLINGDDILFRTPRPRPDDKTSFYEIWKKNISALGFELSVGKNYIHDQVFTVNSECYVISGGKESPPSFRRVRHLDVGLLTNNNACARLENRVLPLADRIQQVLDGAHDKGRVWRRLKHYYREELKSWMQVGRHTTFNVFAAVALGGLGVKAPCGVDPCFTKFQRRMAGFLRKRNLAITNIDEMKEYEVIALSSQRDGSGLCYEVPKNGRTVQWVEPEIIEEKADLQLTKDIRNLPILCREQPITRSSWVKKYSIRSLNLFKKALKDRILSFDADPSSFPKVLALNPQSEAKVDVAWLPCHIFPDPEV